MESPGLTSSRAAERLKEFGPNEIREEGGLRPAAIFAGQFANFLIILLLLAAAVAYALGDRLDSLAILGIVFLNALLGFVQEYKAEKAIAALKKITITPVRVRRDGRETLLDSRELVPGDLIIIGEGAKIPADGRLVAGWHLETNEAALTGESLPILKTAGAGGEEDRVFAGTAVARGRAEVEITATGHRTRFGEIAEKLKTIKNEATPLQKKITALGRQLGWLGLTASLLVLLLASLRGNSLFTSFLTAVSLAVAAVPEGLPAVITITLAVGMQRLARAKTIVRRMTAVETLGSTTVIATDKTGTLTRNQMRVREVDAGGGWQSVPGAGAKLSARPAFQKIIQTAALCSSTRLVFKHDHRSFDVLGDTTEGALLWLLHEIGQDGEAIKRNSERLEEYPFDSAKKMMSVAVRTGETVEVLTKGAPETVLAVCRRQMADDHTKEMDAETRAAIENSFQKAAAGGLRVIAFAGKKLNKLPLRYPRDEAEDDLTFFGLAAIADPPRPEAKEAVKFCRDAGIKVVMITGDNELTANAIATEIGLIGEGEDILTGRQLDDCPDEELQRILPRVRIFARVTPEHKYRIVRAYQALGEVVAVTGDGVNDALALKQADVGAAMGLTGTDVAKEAADVIITDDNFATIARAVEEGRLIFANVKSAVKYLVSCNTGEVLAVLIGMLSGWPLLLTPLQILYINLVTDGLPAVALAVTPAKEAVSKKNPNARGRLLHPNDLPWLLETSLLTVLLTLISFAVGLSVNQTLAQTLAFTTLIFVQHFIFMDLWGREGSSLKLNLLNRGWFLTAFFGALLLQPLLIYQPDLASIFQLTPEQPLLLLFAVVLSAAALLVSETRKMILNRR